MTHQKSQSELMKEYAKIVSYSEDKPFEKAKSPLMKKYSEVVSESEGTYKDDPEFLEKLADKADFERKAKRDSGDWSNSDDEPVKEMSPNAESHSGYNGVEGFDLTDFRDDLDLEAKWQNIEREGPDCVRFDHEDGSLWVNSDGSIEGYDSLNPQLQKTVRRLCASHGIDCQ